MLEAGTIETAILQVTLALPCLEGASKVNEHGRTAGSPTVHLLEEVKCCIADAGRGK